MREYIVKYREYKKQLKSFFLEELRKVLKVYDETLFESIFYSFLAFKQQNPFKLGVKTTLQDIPIDFIKKYIENVTSVKSKRDSKSIV